MSSPGRSWLFLAPALLAVACAGVAPFLLGETERIRIPHARHAQADVPCIACHEDIYEATALGPELLPKEKKCLECHKEEKAKGNCGYCHSAKTPKTYPPRDRPYVINHAEHLEKVEDNCETCHQKLPEPFRRTTQELGQHPCINCHEHKEQYAKGACATCHLDLGRFPLRPVSNFSHRGQFVKDHRQEARSTQQCAQCHEQTFCSDCHAQTVGRIVDLKYPERTDRQFIHRLDFMGRHSVEATADEMLCQRCHGRSFCEDCHTRQQVTQASANPINPHPRGFSDRSSGNFHGRAARREISTCAACHDQGAASNCVECHRVGGFGGNPHPRSWAARHGREEISKDAMCQICHL